MILHYLSDNQGHTTVVRLQIPIEDWNRLKEKYIEFKEEENKAGNAVSEWHVAFAVTKPVRVRAGEAALRDWDEVKDSFIL